LTGSSGFLDYYHQTLRDWVTGADIPPDIKEQFVFESLVKQQAGREVYFVTRIADGKRAVLRVTAEGQAEDIRAEKEILNRLHHPAIPRLLGAWEHQGRGYLARECFEGEDLYSFVRRHGPMSFEQLTDTALALCDVLTYLHGQTPAVIHRDIKPENIIRTSEKDIRLIDFGIARTFREDTDTDTQVIGTKPYMAPEQFGSEQSDNRADIYALGMVMLFLATGKPDRLLLKTAYPYKSLIPVIEKCIRKDRDQRFSTAAQLKRRILWVRRGMTRKALWAAGLALLLVGAFITGLTLGQRQGFKQGVTSILDTPAVINRPFTREQLNEPISFQSEYLNLAVRNILNKTGDNRPILRTEVNSRIDDLRVYGTYILHPDIAEELYKTHLGRDSVRYTTGSGFWIDGRGDISTLDEIPNMYYLRALELTSQHIADLAPLAGMKLTRLNLANNFVGSLLPIKDMVSLTALDVCQNPLRDLWPISRLLSLRELDISQTQVRDLAPLKDLTRLETLSLVYCDVQDISVLAGLNNLKEVDVSHTKVTDLSPLLRKENPITVRCAGLPEKTLSAMRGNPGIILNESGQE
jgi:serine/threonine protein kinase